MTFQELTDQLTPLSSGLAASDYEASGVHGDILLEKGELRSVIELLLRQEFYLVFVTAVSLQPTACLVYQFARHDALLRINLRLFAQENEAPTIADIYHAAMWYEREIHDFFGVVFTGNEDMRPLILSEMDAGFHPLVKAGSACLSAEKLGFLPLADEPEFGDEQPRGSHEDA
ncbi:NADH-quinone oxidoreductase subunit C [Desulfobotulus sp. H1]|uniref:NADH-quinone oxidoreductase subunit C n=1 Tax=Desulfobotulus pelophilus TaxID=2823377 RepID=A0ABT3NAS0_9BACT|nr:NADH-quinone oxidoreductase subunit C [Desulfobotulus pelophilus]MCW7754559.1 NADH-quinone oxidoreductase subunit C [Desulfobotulus pelophilus]